MPVLFFESTAVRGTTLREIGLGGREATTIRVAEAVDALVMQHNLTEPHGRYRPPGAYAGVEHVVVLSDPRPIAHLQKAFPRARFYLWVHDLINLGSKKGIVKSANLLSDLNVTVVCVSHYQSRTLKAALEQVPHGERICIKTIYNPVDDELVPDGSSIDQSKLIFFSSSIKGLAFTLDVFQAL